MAPTPIAQLIAVSRPNPVIRDSNVVKPVTLVLFNMARLMGRGDYTGEHPQAD
jgi:hypothetical protein